MHPRYDRYFTKNYVTRARESWEPNHWEPNLSWFGQIQNHRHVQKKFFLSEWISDGEVQTKPILESFQIVEARAAGLIWGVQTDADIESKH